MSPASVLPFATLALSPQTLCSRFVFQDKKLKQKLRQSEITQFDFEPDLRGLIPENNRLGKEQSNLHLRKHEQENGVKKLKVEIDFP